MTMARERMTWKAADKKTASAPPATPGYGKEDQDHPAHLPDPDMHKYENGDTSAWAEDPKKPPYPQGSPPSIPGYDTEDQDHPAHVDLPRVPKEARLRAAVQRRAAKCVRLAEFLLKDLPKDPKTADLVEDQALDLMDLQDSQIDATFQRIGGGFLAEDNPETLSQELDDLLDEGVPDLEAGKKSEEDAPKTAMDDILLAIRKLSDDVNELKNGKTADQNDPKGPTLAPKPKTEEEARKEAAAEDPIVKEFDTYATDDTGFMMADEWKGSKALFAALDTDRDGILCREDLIKLACGCDLAPMAGKADLEPEEQALLAELETEDPVPAAVEPAPVAEEPKPEEPAPTACEQEDVFGFEHDPMGLADEPVTAKRSEEDELLDQIYGKSAKKSGEDEEPDGDEPEEKEGGKKSAKKSDDEEPEGEKPEDEEKKEGGKKSAKKSDDEDPEDEKPEDEEKKEGGKKASFRTASQRPQARKPSAGVKTVGAVPKTASNEITELSKLWESAPDVSEVFNS